jgi:hypothetical protein
LHYAQKKTLLRPLLDDLPLLVLCCTAASLQWKAIPNGRIQNPFWSFLWVKEKMEEAQERVSLRSTSSPAIPDIRFRRFVEEPRLKQRRASSTSLSDSDTSTVEGDSTPIRKRKGASARLSQFRWSSGTKKLPFKSLAEHVSRSHGSLRVGPLTSERRSLTVSS